MKFNISVEVQKSEGPSILVGYEVSRGNFTDGAEFTVVDTGASVVVHVGLETYEVPLKSILAGIENARAR